LSCFSESSKDVSAVSAPSLTTSRPESGRPLSSSRARSSASPNRVDVPSNERPAAFGTRSDVVANLNCRTAKRWLRSRHNGLLGSAKFFLMYSLRGLPS